MASLTRGEKLGPYEILDPIGAGGMGEVWKARDTRLDRIVALKISKEQFSERFDREARAVAALNHPHICQLYDVGPNYLVMEFIDGAPLKGPLAIEKAVEYAGQILEALDAAHRKGITHRDLKPANILLTKQGIKLLDFGLAKQASPLKANDATVTQALTAQGQIVGTLQYMSPEQLQGKEADARSDLFAFGCVLYELLTGKRAFEGGSAASVIAAILEREPVPLTTAPPIDRIVRRSLAKDPDQRFQTARDLKAALTWAMEQAPLPSPAIPSSRRWQWIAAAALIAGAIAGAWTVSLLRRPVAVNDGALRFLIEPPENGVIMFGNNIGGISLSPDGKTAAYAASGGGKTGLWLRPLDGAIARLLPGTNDAAYPFWSPDGNSIGYFTATQLKRFDLAGGSPLVVCEIINGRGGAWSTDGRIILGTLWSGLFQVAAAGGTPVAVTTPDTARGETSHLWPQVLPGGRFLYFIQGEKQEATGVYVGSFAKPAERLRLVDTDANAAYAPARDGTGYLLWLRGTTLVGQEFDPAAAKLTGQPHPIADPVAKMGINNQMFMAVSGTGLLLYSSFGTISQFTWFDRAGKPQGVVGEAGEYNTFRLSANGHRIAASGDRLGRTDLWLFESGRDVISRLTSAATLNIYPVWSPDGRTIVFSSGSPWNLFERDSDGAGSEQRITRSTHTQLATDWSRDGRWILFYEIAPGTQRDLLVLPVTPGGQPLAGASARPYLQTPFNEYWGRFSPDASPRWVAYESDETGRLEVYIRAFPEPRGKFQISSGGGKFPEWGPGGHELFYVSPDNKLMVAELKLGADSVEASTARELFAMPAVDTGWPPYDAAPDGQRFLVRANPGDAGRPLTVIVNWPALLKKSTITP